MWLGQVLENKEETKQAPRHMEDMQPNGAQAAGRADPEAEAKEEKHKEYAFEQAGPEHQRMQLVLQHRFKRR